MQGSRGKLTGSLTAKASLSERAQSNTDPDAAWRHAACPASTSADCRDFPPGQRDRGRISSKRVTWHRSQPANGWQGGRLCRKSRTCIRTIRPRLIMPAVLPSNGCARLPSPPLARRMSCRRPWLCWNRGRRSASGADHVCIDDVCHGAKRRSGGSGTRSRHGL